MGNKKPKREYKEQILTIDGNIYRFEESGKGSNLLFIPGAGMEPGLYSRIAAELSKSFTVINLARLGRSKMPPRKEGLTFCEEAEYYLPLLNKIGIDYIVGHSSGSVLAAVIAEKYPVKGLVMYEPAICDRSDWMEPFKKLHGEKKYVRAIQYAMKGMGASPFDKLPGIITLPVFYFIYKINTPYVLTFEDCILNEISALNAVYGELKRGKLIKTPALCCYGDATSPMLAQTTRDYYGACEKGVVKVYHKYSHIDPLIDPVPFCGDIIEFIKNNG